jgi:hypothetical protein
MVLSIGFRKGGSISKLVAEKDEIILSITKHRM